MNLLSFDDYFDCIDYGFMLMITVLYMIVLSPIFLIGWVLGFFKEDRKFNEKEK